VVREWRDSMRVMCAKDGGDASGERRPLEGFLRGKPPGPNSEHRSDGQQSGEGAANAAHQQPFGFYRPTPEDEERDRVARRLWKQVFG
jgi:hypothetical protein